MPCSLFEFPVDQSETIFVVERIFSREKSTKRLVNVLFLFGNRLTTIGVTKRYLSYTETKC